MAGENETIEGIVREMRILCKNHTSTDGMEVDDALAQIPLDDYADRIEAAHNRVARAATKEITNV